MVVILLKIKFNYLCIFYDFFLYISSTRKSKYYELSLNIINFEIKIKINNSFLNYKINYAFF